MNAETVRQALLKKIAAVQPETFAGAALEVFAWQAAHNPLYAEYLRLLGIAPHNVRRVDDIPFLPIQFFKTHEVKTSNWAPATVFSSSGTTGQVTSQHAVRDLGWYERLCRQGFEQFYGPVEDYCVLALLPAYLERPGSSLVYMADYFIRQGRAGSGFYLYDTAALKAQLDACAGQGVPVLLLGVSFALWDFAEAHPGALPGVVVMETGGMKGRRREITRAELHEILTRSLGCDAIHGEYGMTELLSQAYAQGEGLFRCAPTMQVRAREVTDPLSPVAPGRTGVLNIIDLGNIDSISFIATDDLGRVHADGSFEVLGRLDNSDLRGCNLMVQELG